MSAMDNLVAFNTQIENAIANIPEEDIINNPNIYRLVKLLSWSKLASGAGGGGGSGGLSRSDLAAELNDIEVGISELDTLLEDIKLNTSNFTGTSAGTITNGVDNSTALQTIEDLIVNYNNLYVKGIAEDIVFDVTIANNDNSIVLPSSIDRVWLNSFTISVSEPCLLRIKTSTSPSENPFYQVLNQKGIEKIYKYPKEITGLPVIFEVSETVNPIRFVGSFEIEKEVI